MFNFKKLSKTLFKNFEKPISENYKNLSKNLVKSTLQNAENIEKILEQTHNTYILSFINTILVYFSNLIKNFQSIKEKMRKLIKFNKIKKIF